MATDSLVLQLQQESLDVHTSILVVLRKALVVAKKLALPDFQNWIEKELHGYGPGDDIPEYRVVSGQLKAWNPLRGWIPTAFEDTELAKRLSKRPIGQAIGELETLLKTLGPKSSLIVPLDPELEVEIMHAGRLPLQASLHITRAAAHGILDQVRTSVLNWCLDLEQAGILGEGMTFSPEEKRSASHVNYNVHFHRDVTNAQIQQGTTGSDQSMSLALDIPAIKSLASQISKSIDQLVELSEGQKQQLTAELKTVEAQLEAPQPRNSVVRECFASIRNILEGCAGSLVASGLLQHMSTFFS